MTRVLAAEAAAHHGPHALIEPALEWLVVAINVVGAAVLAWAVLCGTIQLVRIELRRQAGRAWDRQRSELRRSVGFYLIFALELLIAADIIETMIRPDLQSLGVLAAIVVLRVVISFSLNWELQHERQESPHAPPASLPEPPSRPTTGAPHAETDRL